jgi:hypothetical protein
MCVCDKLVQQDAEIQHLSNVTVITATVSEAVMLVLLMGGIYELRH